MDPEDLSKKVRKLITQGTLDDHLELIHKILIQRREIVQRRQAREQLRAIEIGDTVRIKMQVKPKYLAGLECTVRRVTERHMRGMPLIDCQFVDGPVGKFRSGGILLTPASFDIIRKRQIVREINDGETTITLVQ